MRLRRPDSSAGGPDSSAGGPDSSAIGVPKAQEAGDRKEEPHAAAPPR